MTTAYLALLALVGVGRFVELRISHRNQRQLEKQGVRKIAEPHFRWMVFVHAGVLAGAAAEVMLLHRRRSSRWQLRGQCYSPSQMRYGV
jgi:methyltransferase